MQRTGFTTAASVGTQADTELPDTGSAAGMGLSDTESRGTELPRTALQGMELPRGTEPPDMERLGMAQPEATVPPLDTEPQALGSAVPAVLLMRKALPFRGPPDKQSPDRCTRLIKFIAFPQLSCFLQSSIRCEWPRSFSSSV
jgi:hypothetical protein